MIFIDLEDPLHVAERALGHPAEVRDHGLLGSALARPQATVHGKDAYPSIHDKAAALLHSLARYHALVDGNKRLALATTLAFLGINGARLTLDNDEAYALVVGIASGTVDDAVTIAAALAEGSEPSG